MDIENPHFELKWNCMGYNFWGGGNLYLGQVAEY